MSDGPSGIGSAKSGYVGAGTAGTRMTPRSPVVRPGHPGGDDHDLVTERLEVPPDRLDGGGHTAEHREVVVREETDSEAHGRGAGYILYLPKSSGFRFSSHSFSFS